MKNKALAIRIIKKDCEISGFYCKDGRTCAIGALALAAGVKKEDFHDYNGSLITFLPKPITDKIMNKFGLTLRELEYVQHRNDMNYSPEERRKAILELSCFK